MIDFRCLSRWPLLLTLGVVAISMLTSETRSQGSRLGSVEFPTSARSQEAQEHFLRGVAALHSFWYPVALEEFRAAARIEPGFAMAHWGEAMAHNHPVWGDPQETEAARQVLSRLPAPSDVTPRERGYLDAVRALYGQGEKPPAIGPTSRPWRRSTARTQTTWRRPRSTRLPCSVSPIPAARPMAGRPRDPAALRTRMQAAAIAQEVYRREPNHPGGAHYILHAFDDPDHAVLALPAARRYAEIAPAAPHALHMPSHIFLQLGMWPEAAASNEASWKASTQREDARFPQPALAALRATCSRVAWMRRGLCSRSFATAWPTCPRTTCAIWSTAPTSRRPWPPPSWSRPRQWDRGDGAAGVAADGAQLRRQAPGGGPYQAFAALAQAPAVFARVSPPRRLGQTIRNSTIATPAIHPPAGSPAPRSRSRPTWRPCWRSRRWK